MTSQVCRKCGTEKPLTDFNKDATKNLGVRRICKPCHRSEVAQYVQDHREQWKVACRRWYDNNKDRKLAYDQQYRANYTERQKELKRLVTNARWRVLRSAMPAWADAKAMRDFYAEAARTGMHVDHIVPLRGRIVSGLHVPANLCLLPPSENQRKSNRWWPDMP